MNDSTLYLRGRPVGSWDEQVAKMLRQVTESESQMDPRWDAFCRERGGWACRPFVHGHGWTHGNATFDAATGEMRGVFTIVAPSTAEEIAEHAREAAKYPDGCPICRDFDPADWSS